jgi:hypothetical protein
MADKTAAHIKEKGHMPDKNEDPGTEHCPHCADHHARLSAVEAHLGMATEHGVAAEETGAHKEKKPSYTRKRH